MPDFDTCRQTMLLYLKARIPFISLRTDERDRALELLRSLAAELNLPVFYHTISQGARDLVANRIVNEDRSVAGALDYASHRSQRQNLTFVLTEVQDIDGDTPITWPDAWTSPRPSDRAGRSDCSNHHFQHLAAITAPGHDLHSDAPNEDEMRAIIADLPRALSRIVPDRLGGGELTEAATISSGVTRIQRENADCDFLAKGSILKSDLAELSKAKGPHLLDIAGLKG